MGLSDEGLVLVLAFTWAPVIALHALIIHRIFKLRRGALSEANKNLIALVAFILVISIYTIACTVSIYAALEDKEKDRSFIALLAETVWLLSPVVGTLSATTVNSALFSTSFKIFPSGKPEWNLCLKRALLFGIPFCFVFSAGDQVLRKLITLVVTSDPNVPIPIREEFLTAVGSVFGYNGGSMWVSHILGTLANFTIGPLVDLFAPASDSVYEFGNAAGTGIALYFLYAIPEEIGWTGTLYPLLCNHFRHGSHPRWAVGKSILLTGVVWGLWHVPFIVLKGDPDAPSYMGMLYNLFFLLSCVATRAVLVPLVWPVHRPASHLLEGETETVTTPSLMPAILAHAAMNVWWNFCNCLYDWKAVPVWSLLTGSEYSLLAVVWQFGIAFLVTRMSWKRRETPTSQSVAS